MNRRWLRVLLGLFAIAMLADFVFRGIIPALGPGKNDFSEVYVGAWLLRHGQNFYDVTLSTAAGNQLGNVGVDHALIYPPTTLVLMAPFTFLPLPWAALVWLLLGLAGIALTIFLLIRLSGFKPPDDRALLLATFILAFDPLHQAFHLGNIALIAVPLCFLGTFLATSRHDFASGAVLGIAIALKPQLGIWFLIFFLIQFRKRILAGALLAPILLGLAFLRYPVPAATLMSSYRSNLEYWFAPGGLYGFTEGALPFHVNTTQIIFYQLVHRVRAASLLAHGLFALGLSAWGSALWRYRCRVSVPLAISSLAALSFISLYHSVSDVTILTLALCWIFSQPEKVWNGAKWAALVLLLLLALPGHSALMRLSPYLAAWLTESWWWKLLVARYFVWLLVGFNLSLLYPLLREGFSSSEA
jgi:hypothetical protein